MATITVSLPSDGTTIEAADYNTPINTIVNEINGNLDNNNIASAAAISGSKLADASITNAKLSTATGEIGAAWQSWTPTFVNLSGGTLNFAKYTRIGKTIFFRWKYTLGGAGVAGDVTFTLPVAEHSDYSTAAVSPMGDVNFRDTGTDNLYGQIKWSSSGIAVIRAMAAGGTYLANNTALSSTVPFTWANTDEIHAQGRYEAS